MSSQVKIVEKKRGQWMLPALGFILIVALTILAYYVAPSVIQWSQRTFDFTRASTGMNQNTLRWIFTAIVGGILLLFAVLMVTIAGRRKRPLDVTNKSLEQERNQMIADKKMMKRRQRRMNQEMREYVKNNQKN